MQKSTAEALGLLVIATPVLVPVVWVVIALLLSWFAATFPRTRSRKITAAIFAFFLLCLMPTWDQIAGLIYFHHLCTTEGGIKVYTEVDHSVGISPSTGRLEGKAFSASSAKAYLDKNKPFSTIPHERLVAPIGAKENYVEVGGPTYGNTLPFKITKHVYSIYFVGNLDKPLGTWTTYGYGGGWLYNHIALQPVGRLCGADEVGRFANLLEGVFVHDGR